MIDEYNASSDIGTIAFLDNFAKSNTTKYICNTRDIRDNISKIYTSTYLNAYEYKNKDDDYEDDE